MRVARPVIGASLLVLLVLTLAPAAVSAAPQTQFPVNFTIDADNCSDITSDVTGSGVWREVTNTRVGKDGLTYVTYNSTATGTAVDEQGTTYRFNYSNQQTYALPADGSPFQIRMSDQFNLVGAGGANQIHVGFMALITVTTPGDFSTASFDLFINQRGYSGAGFPPCDPI
jgi:hypothetical protein